jgi:hypothetical protein
MKLSFLALGALLLVGTLSFAQQQDCDSQVPHCPEIIKKTPAPVPAPLPKPPVIKQ